MFSKAVLLMRQNEYLLSKGLIMKCEFWERGSIFGLLLVNTFVACTGEVPVKQNQ